MNKYPWRLPVVLLASGLLLVGWLLLCESSVANGNLITLRYVAADGDCGANTPCYAQLQAAVDAANDGDELLVAAGLYTGVSERNGTTQLVYLDKSIAVWGGYDPQTWVRDPALNPTILDAQGLGRVLFIIGNISPTVDGFHLINGSAGNGGGAYIDTAAVVLSHNEIHGNWSEGSGGGVYLTNSAATIASNHICTNTTGATGRGGGLAIINSPAAVDDNIVEDNRAFVGGGIELNNTLGTAGALLTGNTIRNNVAFDYQQFDGAGGGIDTYSLLTDTLRYNTISGNTAKWGGGVHAFGAAVSLINNTIQENEAATHGGGLYIQGGQVRLESNDILSNTASSWGGGLTLHSDNALVHANTFRGNVSSWRGGGMYESSHALFDSNLFLDNTATYEGGGAFLSQGGHSVYQNNVFVGNQAAAGGGLYIWAANARFIHSTIANNSSGDGRAVEIDKYPGLVDPGAPTQYTATVVFTNTIVAGQPVGFFATADNSLTVDGVLWWATPTHFQADGVDLTVLNEHTGDPTFQADGYHLQTYSAARDRGRAALDHDVDGQLRDWGDQKDLGADEHMPTVLIDPDIGGTLTYIDPQEGVTITLDVPPGVISASVALMLSPYPPLPPDVMDSPFGDFFAVGPPFHLEPFQLDPSVPVTDPLNPPLGDPLGPLVFGFPADLLLEYDLETLERLREHMDTLELQLLALIGGVVVNPPQNPACGDVDHDPETRTLDIPICNTGYSRVGPPPPPPPPPPYQTPLDGPLCDMDIVRISQSATSLPTRLLAVDPESETGYFIFVVEIQKTKVYLPLIVR